MSSWIPEHDDEDFQFTEAEWSEKIRVMTEKLRADSRKLPEPRVEIVSATEYDRRKAQEGE